MLRKVLLGLAFWLAASCAHAQTAPSPADVGISKGNPDTFKLKDSSNTWAPFGTVDPTTHVFTPVGGGGSIVGGTTPVTGVCPNGQFLYNNASVVGCATVAGGGSSSPVTLYPTHALLTAGVTTPAGGSTVEQQGFYAAGDGGQATYQWSASSYCSLGTSGAPVATDDIVCIAPGHPAPYTSSIAGRYLLSTGGSIDVRQIGMKPGGFDNAPLVQTLMNAISPSGSTSGGMEVLFPPTAGQVDTYFYFSEPFVVARGSRINCKGGLGYDTRGPVTLVFPPGVTGVVQEVGYLTPDGGWGLSDITGCGVTSLGGGSADGAVNGSNTLNTVNLQNSVGSSEFTFPSSCNPGANNFCTIGVGDGFIAISGWEPPNGAPAVPTGTYVTASNPAARTLTLSSPVQNMGLYNGNCCVTSVAIWDLPASQKYLIRTTAGGSTEGVNNVITIISGPRVVKPGDMIWSDAFRFGATATAISNGVVGTPTVHAGGSGYVGTSGTMTWSGLGCGGGFGAAPVLNVTASGGVITGVTGIASAGDCLSVTPSSSATTWTPGGGLSGGGGASFNMTFNEIVTLNCVYLINCPTFALTTHAPGAEGQMWTIPAGIVRRTQTSTHNVAVDHFGFGLRGECEAGLTPPNGCNSSFDEQDQFRNTLVGRMMRGDNTGISTAIGGAFADNSIADEVEAGTIGSNYFSEQYSSAEHGTSSYGFLGLCITQNYSVIYGPYMSGQGGYCMGADASGWPALGAGITSSPGTMTFIGSMYGSPEPSIGPGPFLNGRWTFEGAASYNIPTQAATTSGNTLTLNNVPAITAGMSVNDLTTPAAIPASTTVTSSYPSGVILSNNVAGAGVGNGDNIQFNKPSGDRNCTVIDAGVNNLTTGLAVSIDCISFLSLEHNGFLNAWDLGPMVFAGGGYKGYSADGLSHMGFSGGIFLGNSDSDAANGPLIDVGDHAPSERTWHAPGDVRFVLEANLPNQGSNLMWSNVNLGRHPVTADAPVGSTTISIDGCQAVTSITNIIGESASAAGTYAGIGTAASCVGTTLTLQAPSVNALHNGSVVDFVEWRPAAPISNDANGTRWSLGYEMTLAPTTYASLTATACTAGTFAVISDGSASPVYNATASGGGGTIDPVFCTGGNVWKYH